VEYHTAGDEHGRLTSKDGELDVHVCDKIELYPSHCCTTINLYDKFYGIRNNEVEVVWDILARGKSQ
jgi:D-serine deaminase-like pyridoxal phosphate-dependent protein